MISQNWFVGKRAGLVRDVLRDYCLVYRGLSQQRERFARDRTLSFATLRDLLGSEQQKGVFWRLKDNTHLFFRHGLFHADMLEAPLPDITAEGDGSGPAGLLLDWCVGHAFHECWKLMEDAYQQTHYACYLKQLVATTSDCSLHDPLAGITEQTSESSARELERIFRVLGHARLLLTRFMANEGENGLLARFLVDDADLVREVFGETGFAALMHALYGDDASRLWQLAAQDLRRAGRPQQAQEVLRRAPQSMHERHEPNESGAQ